MLAAVRTLWTLGRGVVGGLPDLTPADDPIAFFQRWFAEARAAGIYLPESMAVATASPDGAPADASVGCVGGPMRNFVSVAVSAPYRPTLPYPGLGDLLTLSATATLRVR